MTRQEEDAIIRQQDLLGSKKMFEMLQSGGTQARAPGFIGQQKPASGIPMVNPQNLAGNQAMIQASLPLSPQQRASLSQIRRPQDMLFGQPVFGRS